MGQYLFGISVLHSSNRISEDHLARAGANSVWHGRTTSRARDRDQSQIALLLQSRPCGHCVSACTDRRLLHLVCVCAWTHPALALDRRNSSLRLGYSAGGRIAGPSIARQKLAVSVRPGGDGAVSREGKAGTQEVVSEIESAALWSRYFQ